MKINENIDLYLLLEYLVRVPVVGSVIANIVPWIRYTGTENGCIVDNKYRTIEM